MGREPCRIPNTHASGQGKSALAKEITTRWPGLFRILAPRRVYSWRLGAAGNRRTQPRSSRFAPDRHPPRVLGPIGAVRPSVGGHRLHDRLGETLLPDDTGGAYTGPAAQERPPRGLFVGVLGPARNVRDQR